MSQEYWDFILPPYREDDRLAAGEKNLCVQQMDFGYQSVYADSRGLAPLTIEEYWYNSIPQCYALLDMDALNAAGILTVQNYPTLQLMGEHIMIGFLDTGIDYTNEVFRKIDGTTRIVGIWDQTVQSGAIPEGLDYGSEYTEELLNEALRSEDPLSVVPSMDENGHGTYVASVAAGGANVENHFLGAAPEAEIGVVKLKPAKDFLKDFYAIRREALCYQENDIMLGMRYLNQLAKKKNLPLVICLPLGTNFGGHNGTSLLSAVTEAYSYTANRCVVVGTGNEAAERHHYFGSFRDRRDAKEAEIRVGEGIDGFVAEVWSTIPNVVTVSVTSPSGEHTGEVTLSQGYQYHFIFTFERTELTVEYRLLLENNDSQLIFMRFDKPVSGVWKIRVAPVQMSEGEFHIWLPVQEFLGGDVYFLQADPDTTLTEPGTGRGVMTVAYYNGIDNGVDINSGRGYTRDMRIKPDYAAPGISVTGAGLHGRFVARSGSSAATGIAAGAAALLMGWILEQPGAQEVSASQIRNIIILGTNQKVLGNYPNREWGYGTLDVFSSLDRLRQI